MTGRKVYTSIVAIIAELSKSGIAKSHANEGQGWLFRGIDDVYNALSPLLAKHRLCILPRIIQRNCSEGKNEVGERVNRVALEVAFDIVSAVDGSAHTVEVWGEAIDSGDKATNKALTAAYKYAAFQVFCIPVAGQADADLHSPSIATVTSRSFLPPVQGWQQWVSDITDMLEGCQTEEAVARVQQTYRADLRELSKAEPWMFRRVGSLVAERKRQLAFVLQGERPDIAVQTGGASRDDRQAGGAIATGLNGKARQRRSSDATAPATA